MPSPLQFLADDAACLDFVVAAANLRAFNFGLPTCIDRKVFLSELPSVVVPEFRAQTDMKIAANDEELKKLQQSAPADDQYEQIRKLESALPDRAVTRQEVKLAVMKSMWKLVSSSFSNSTGASLTS